MTEQDVEAAATVPLTADRGEDVDATEIKPEDTKPLAEADVNPKSRGCTDILCCLLFLACITALIIFHVICFAKDNPFKILRPLDHAGNSCGVGDYKEFPLVYYPAKKMIGGGQLVEDAYYGNPKNRWAVCTNECPTVYTRKDRAWACRESLDFTKANPGVDLTGNTTAHVCTWYSATPSTKILGKYCIGGLGTSAADKTGLVCTSAQQAVADVHAEAKKSFFDMGNVSTNDLKMLKTRVSPSHVWVITAIEKSLQEDSTKYAKAIDDIAKQAKEKNIVNVCTDAVASKESFLVSFAADILNAPTVLILSAVVCLFFGLLYVIMICKFVKIVVWGSLLVSMLGFSITGYLLWTQGLQVKDTGLLEQGQEEMILAVICWVIAAILIIVVAFCRRALQLAIAISETTSSFLMKNIAVMFFPQVIALYEIVWVGYWMAATAAIMSTAKVKPAHDLTQEINRFQVDAGIIAGLIFHCYVGLWVHFFFEGLAVVTTSITVTTWYFSPKVKGKKRSQQFGVVGAFFQALLYHLGSIAFGSCLVPLAMLLQVIIKVLQDIGQKAIGKDSGVFKVCCCCLSCCTRFLTSSLQFINQAAYIMVGVQGKNFCKSGFEMWALMARNPKRFVIFKGVMWTLDVVCRFILVGVSLAFASLFLQQKLSPEVKSPWPVLIAVALIGFFISGLISSVYATSGAALFCCFVVDEEISKSTGRDFTLYAPSGLQGMFDAETKKSKSKKDEE